MAKLPQTLKRDPFNYAQAKSYGIDLSSLRALERTGAIERMARGVYRATGQDYPEVEQYKVATLLVGQPSAICLISALSHYGITDVIPKKTWVMVPHGRQSSHKTIKLLRVRQPDWKIGIAKEKGYCITSIERTLVEVIYYQRIVGITIAIDALRRAVQNKQTSLSSVLSMAKKLKALHRVLPYIEALA
jgi:predicted transcriptional regulator of viral defense system